VPAAAIANGDLCFIFGHDHCSHDHTAETWGKLAPKGKGMSAEYPDKIEATLDMIATHTSTTSAQDGPSIRFFLGHTGMPHLLLPYEEKLRARFNVKDITSACFSPILAVHTGPTVLIVAWSIE
jgi:fatty acid-binding protein DegV